MSKNCWGKCHFSSFMSYYSCDIEFHCGCTKLVPALTKPSDVLNGSCLYEVTAGVLLVLKLVET